MIGYIEVNIKQGLRRYDGATSNGIRSQSYAQIRWDRSYTVTAVRAQCPTEKYQAEMARRRDEPIKVFIPTPAPSSSPTEGKETVKPDTKKKEAPSGPQFVPQREGGLQTSINKAPTEVGAYDQDTQDYLSSAIRQMEDMIDRQAVAYDTYFIQKEEEESRAIISISQS